MRGIRAVIAAAVGLTLASCSTGSADPAAAPTPTPTSTVTAHPAPTLTTQVDSYRAYVVRQATQLRVDGRAFTDALRAGDLAAARKQYAPSRYRWEAIEPIALLVSRFDIALDARVEDYSSPADPQWTGWHKIEYLLWAKGTTAGTRPLADKLDRDLATLARAVTTVPITPAAVIKGSADLVAEVSDGKITGEEDRYSHTDLSDFAANVEGAKAACTVFRAVLRSRAPQLATTLDTGFAQVEASLAPYRTGSIYRLYPALTPDDKLRMQAHLATLSESLATVPHALALA